MYKFQYQKAVSLDEARESYAASDDPRYIAGGMTLLPALNLRLDRPSTLLDIGQLSELEGIEEKNGGIKVGALSRHRDVSRSELIQDKIPALARLASSIGDPLVRNRGTLGGSLANNDPAADYPAAVLGLKATIHTDQREIPADDFFQGIFETALEQGELITGVTFFVPEDAGYGRLANPASRFPVIGVFVAKYSDGARVTVTGSGSGVFRVPEMEKVLSQNWSVESVKDIRVSSQGFSGDLHASAEYRTRMVTVMAERALTR